jgi:hypothetical protein
MTLDVLEQLGATVQYQELIYEAFVVRRPRPSQLYNTLSTGQASALHTAAVFGCSPFVTVSSSISSDWR